MGAEVIQSFMCIPSPGLSRTEPISLSKQSPEPISRFKFSKILCQDQGAWSKIPR